MIKSKKGIQLNEAFTAILTVVLVAVLIIVALYLFGALGNSMQVQNTAGIYANETVNRPTPSGVTLYAASLEDGQCGAVTSILNSTSGNVAIGLGNITQTGCSIVNATNWVTLGYSSTVRMTYSYTYTAESSASNATNDTVDQFATYPALIGLLGTIIFLGIVIGVLVASFMPRNSP